MKNISEILNNNTAIFDAVHRLIAFKFNDEIFHIDLTEGDLEDSWNFIETKDGQGYDFNFSWEEGTLDKPSMCLYEYNEGQNCLGENISFSIVKVDGTEKDYFSPDKFKTLSDFLISQRVITPKSFEKNYGDVMEDNVREVFMFGGFYVEGLKDKKYHLIIGRDSYLSENLREMITILWDDFAKWELGLTSKEAYYDLDIRAKFLLDQLGYECSLDEVELEKLNPEQQKKVNYLLRQFDEAGLDVQEKNRTYRVMAKVTTYCYLDVVAKSQEEAIELGEKADGGDFLSQDDGGEWNVYDAQLQEA